MSEIDQFARPVVDEKDDISSLARPVENELGIVEGGLRALNRGRYQIKSGFYGALAGVAGSYEDSQLAEMLGQGGGLSQSFIDESGRQASKASRSENLPSLSVEQSHWYDPSAKWIWERGVESAPQLAMQIGAAALTRGRSAATRIASFAAANAIPEAGQVYADARNRGVPHEVAATEAALSGVGVAAMDALPGSEYLLESPLSKQVFSNLVRSRTGNLLVTVGADFTAEAVTEAAQEVLPDFLRWSMENDPAAFEDWQTRYPDAAVIGGAVGGGFGVSGQAVNGFPGQADQQSPEDTAAQPQTSGQMPLNAPDQSPAAPSKASLETAQSVMQWAIRNKSAAQKLVDRLDSGKEISRKAWRESASKDDPLPDGLPQSDRADLVRAMKGAIADGAATATATPPVAPVGQAATASPPPTPPQQPAKPKAAGDFALPKDLAGAKPRYSYGAKQFEVDFDSDLDRSLYILAQQNKSRRDADYLNAVTSHTGMTEDEARAAGEQIRASIKAMAKDAKPGRLAIPASSFNQLRSSPPVPPPAPMADVTPPQPASAPTPPVDAGQAALGPIASSATVVAQADSPKMRYRTLDSYGPQGQRMIKALANQAQIDLDSGDGETLIQWGAEFYGAGRRREPMPVAKIHPEDAQLFYAAGQRDSIKKVSPKNATKGNVNPLTKPQPAANDVSSVTSGVPTNGQEEADAQVQAQADGRQEGLLAPTSAPPASESTAVPASAAPSTVASLDDLDESFAADTKAAIAAKHGGQPTPPAPAAKPAAKKRPLRKPKAPAATAPVTPDVSPATNPATSTTPPVDADQAEIDRLKSLAAEKAKKLADKFRTKLGVNPLDPELISDTVDLTVIVVKLLAKQGQVKFRDYVRKMAEYFDKDVMRRAAPYMQDAWEAVRAKVPNAKLDEATDILPLIDETGATANEPERTIQSEPQDAATEPISTREGEGDVGSTGGPSGAGVSDRGGEVQSNDQPVGGDATGGAGLANADQRSGGEGDSAAPQGAGEPGAGDASDANADAGAGVRSEQPETPAVQPGERQDDDQDAGPRDGLSVGNYRIEPEAIGKGSPKSKYRQNVAAIKLLKDMIAEGRTRATREEQDVLSKYTGWGALPGVFNEDADDGSEWSKERDEIKALLTDAEWTSAMESTTNAHYTSPQIVQGMWDMVKRMGFTGGRVLEPSAGVGNFIGLQPAELAGASQWSAVELDSLTGAILERLYPDAKTKVQGFQEFVVPDGFYDLVVSNVPFSGKERILSDRKYKKYRPFIHDYFFLKSIDKVRPGGLVVFVTSTGTLDKESSDIRAEIAKQADLVYAARLPEGTFGKNAGTAVVTDIIVLRKRFAGEEAGDQSWVNVGTVPDPDGGKDIPINQYYVDHPEQVLGIVDRKSRMYGKGNPHVSAPDDFEARWEQAIESVPESAFTPATDAHRIEYRPQLMEPGDQPGQLKVADGKLYAIDRTSRVEIPPPEPHPTHAPTTTRRNNAYKKKIAMVGDFEPVRQAARAIINNQLEGKSQEDREAGRKAFEKEYDKFVKKHGPFSSKSVLTALSDDVDYDLVMSAEEWDEESETAKKGSFFYKDTIRPDVHHGKAESIEQAISQSLDGAGRLDIAMMAESLGKTEDQVADQLTKAGIAYEDPNAGWVTADEYLSGNVRVKLLDARAAAEIDKRYERNVAALEAVVPADKPYDEIMLPRGPGSPWMPVDILPEFAAYLFNGEPADFENGYIETSGEWRFDFSAQGAARHSGSPADFEAWGTPDKPFVEVMDALLHGQKLTVKRRDPDGNVWIDVEATEAANAKITELQEEFLDWVWADKDRRDRLVRVYNDRHNSTVKRRYNGSHMTFPGMAPPGTQMGSMTFNGLRPHQANAVWQTVVRGKGILAHEVGTGKTMTMVAGAMELRRLGRARKPAIVVPDSRVEATAREARQLYPAARILTAARGMGVDERRATVAKIATGDWDIVILTHQNIGVLPVSAQLRQRYINEQLDEIDTLLREEGIADFSAEALKKAGRGNRIVKRLAALRKAARERLAAATNLVKDTGVTFEETGIDFLFVDEAHQFKSLPIRTRLANVKGIPSGDAERAVNMEMISNYVQGINQGRGIVLATGTPLTNSLAELYVLQRFVQRKELQESGLLAFDAWAATFASITTRQDFNHAGDVSEQTRFSDFVNVKELRQMVGTDLDVVRVLDDPLLASKLDRPEKVDVEVVIPSSEAQQDYMASIAVRAAALKGRHDPKIDNHLKLATDGTKAALDIRLVMDLPEDAETKVRACAENVIKVRKEVPDATQMVFVEKGRSDSPSFDVGADLVAKLVAGGIPKDKILDFRGVGSDKKDALVQRLRTGDAWVAIGNTMTLGTGVNAQDYLAAIHHLEPSWTPEALEQRVGRGWRQGNRNSSKKLVNYTYLTAGSLDSWRYGVVAIKARGFENFLLDKLDSGSMSNDDAEDFTFMGYERMQALASGNPLRTEQINVQNDVATLARAQVRWERSKNRMRSELGDYRSQRTIYQDRLAAATEDQATAKAADGKEFEMMVDGTTYTERKDAAAALGRAYRRAMRGFGYQSIGTFNGFDIQAYGTRGVETVTVDVRLAGKESYSFNGQSLKEVESTGAIQSLAYTFRAIAKGDYVAEFQNEVDFRNRSIDQTEASLRKPWRDAEKYRKKVRLLARLDSAIRQGLTKLPPEAETLVQAYEDQLADMHREAFQGDPNINLVGRTNRPELADKIEAAFPGSVVSTEGQRDGSWLLQLPSGALVRVNVVNNIEIDWDAAEDQAGREFDDDERAQIIAAGSFEMKGIPGIDNALGMLSFAKGVADGTTARHESIHVARQLGLFTDKEWRTLVEAHSSKDRTDTQQEEDVASAAEAWRGKDGISQKVVDWIRTAMAKLGFGSLKPDTVHRLMQKPSFWMRNPNRGGRGTSYQLRRTGPRADLAKVGLTSEVRDIEDKVDADRNARGAPTTRKEKAVRAEAKRILDRDYAKARAKILKLISRGRPLTDTETVMAGEIINREGMAAATSGDKKKMIEVTKFVDARRESGAIVARSLRIRRDPLETTGQKVKRHIVEALTTPSDVIQGKLDEAKKNGDTERIKSLYEQAAKELQELLDKLRAMGIDPDNLDNVNIDPGTGAKIIGAIKSRRSTLSDAFFEYWRNAILSAPPTHVANLAGNIGFGIWHYLAERPVEMIVNQFLGVKDAATISEVRYMLRGVLPGLSRGLRNFWTSFMWEIPQFESSLGREETNPLDNEPQVAIKGLKGRIIRLPQRLLLAADELAKTFISQVEVGAQAYRIAKTEGLSGQKLSARIAALTADTESDAWTAALKKSRELTFQQKGSGVAYAVKKSLLKARKDVKIAGWPILNWILPFVTTPINILEAGLKRTPLGSVSFAARVLKAARTGNWHGVPQRAAQQLIAWSLVMALMGNDDEDERPRITGADTQSETGPRELSQRTYPPQSIRIGNHWYSYGRIEPFATVLASTVDLVRAVQSGDTERMIKTPFSSLVGQITEKTFLSGVSDLFEVVKSQDRADAAAKWAANFAVSWVPNIVRTAGRAMDETIPERGVWGNGEEWYQRLGKRTLQRTEVAPIADVPKYDLWGRPIKSSSVSMPRTDVAWRLLLPVRAQAEDVFVGDRILMQWNRENPGNEKYPAMPRKDYQVDGKRKYMTEEQYGQFLQLSGSLAATMVAGYDPNKVSEAIVEQMSNDISAARKAVKESLLNEWNGKSPAGSAYDRARKELIKDLRNRMNSPPPKITAAKKDTIKQERDAWVSGRQSAAEAIRRLTVLR